MPQRRDDPFVLFSYGGHPVEAIGPFISTDEALAWAIETASVSTSGLTEPRSSRINMKIIPFPNARNGVIYIYKDDDGS